jgi:hypothetical protein
MGQQRLFQSSFFNTSLKLPIKPESLGNEVGVDYFMYWREYGMKESAEYLLDDREIQPQNKQRNTKCAFMSNNKNAGPM